LLDTMEHLLKEFDFPDPYLLQKTQENEAALSLLPARLEHLDQMEEIIRHEELVKAILAGNMFDWGAKEAAKLISRKGFGLEDAAAQLQGKKPLLFLFKSTLSNCNSD